MKKILIMMALLVFALSGCGETQHPEVQDEEETVTAEESEREEDVGEESETSDSSELEQTFADWILGTEYGIEEIVVDSENATLEIRISDANYATLEDWEISDIEASIEDILSAHKASGYSIAFSNGQSIDAIAAQDDEETVSDGEEQTEDSDQTQALDETVNLIFIHHSVGENWLYAGLNEMLNEDGFHVADTYYGWREMGDSTDTSDWPDWFNDDVMPTVYNELGNMTGYNNIEPADGENTIIMFKSCFPNSDVGNSIDDEKEIYLSLLDYFAEHPDKMFVFITPPPMQSISHPDKTRELANWLVSEDGWRKDYAGNNLFVFDFYNVLTAEDNHHMLVDGQEVHIINDSSNTLYYDSAGDDHPNDEGSLKAAEEFVPLLIYWYGIFTGN